jgi:hypothetical protein
MKVWCILTWSCHSSFACSVLLNGLLYGEVILEVDGGRAKLSNAI